MTVGSAPSPADPLAAAADAAQTYALESKSPATRQAYATSWATFEAWCGRMGLEVLPASDETIALYLAARAETGRRPSYLTRELAGISNRHIEAGLPSSWRGPLTRAVLKGIRRRHGVAARQVEPIVIFTLMQLVAALEVETLIGCRDRALLLFGFASAMRRSELAALEVQDLEHTPEGIRVRIRVSKTDQAGGGQVVAVPFGRSELCPVKALREWLERARLTSGRVFRSVDRHENLGESITDQVVAHVVKRTAMAAGLDPRKLSGHSLRAGLVTEAARAGKALHIIMRQTRHRSPLMVLRYIRAFELWQDNAADGIGL